MSALSTWPACGAALAPWLLGACVFGALLVFAVMIYSIATFRGATYQGLRSLHTPERRRLRRNAWVEILWALVPVAIVAATATPALRCLV